MKGFEERDSYEEKNYQLFLRQKKMLENFAERGAISEEYYAQEITILIKKMHILVQVFSKWYMSSACGLVIGYALGGEKRCSKNIGTMYGKMKI